MRRLGASEAEQIAGLLDVRLKDLPAEQRVVTLRVDKEVRFAQTQYALAGIAANARGPVRRASTWPTCSAITHMYIIMASLIWPRHYISYLNGISLLRLTLPPTL